MHDLEEEMKDQLKQGNATAAGLFAIAAQLQTLAVHLKYLGVGDAATTMGAIEYLGVHLGEKLDVAGQAIVAAIERVADE